MPLDEAEYMVDNAEAEYVAMLPRCRNRDAAKATFRSFELAALERRNKREACRLLSQLRQQLAA